MKKILLIFILQNLFQQLSLAQTDTSTKCNSKIIISIAGGTATPEGVFGKYVKDFDADYTKNGNNIAGGASNGYFAKLDFSYLIHQGFGATAMVYSSMNSGKALTQNELQIPSSNALGGGFRIISYSNDTKNWYTNGVLLGIYTEATYNRLSIDFKFLLGAQQVKSPEAHMYEEGYNWQMGIGVTDYYRTVETQPSMISYNLVGNLGIDSRYRFSKRVSVKIGIENFFSQAVFDGNLTYITDKNFTNGTTGHSEDQKKIHFTKNVFIFGLSAGISYSIK